MCPSLAREHTVVPIGVQCAGCCGRKRTGGEAIPKGSDEGGSSQVSDGVAAVLFMERRVTLQKGLTCNSRAVVALVMLHGNERRR